MKYEVIDNFLPQDQFDNLKKLATGPDMLWHRVNQLNDKHNEKEDFDLMFVHLLFESNMYPPSSTFFEYFAFLQDRLDCKSLRRMKLNLYPHTSEIRTHTPHIDYDFEHKGCILSFNTCDGATVLEDGTKIDSIENRALIFDASKPHSSTSTTNARALYNLNINYF